MSLQVLWLLNLGKGNKILQGLCQQRAPCTGVAQCSIRRRLSLTGAAGPEATANSFTPVMSQNR